MTLPEIISESKEGTEKFHIENQTLDFNLIEFWKWNQSNLIENRTRGILSEFIVKKALGIESDTRVEWDNYDLVSNTGKRIEIKSAAYIQSWKQKKYSKIIFGISPTIGAKDHPEYDGKKRRWSDFYVFCLLKNKNQKTINPLDLNQWTFYILKSEILDKQIPTQKSINLNSLLRLKPIECEFSELRKTIEE